MRKRAAVIILFDIGNTHTHLALAEGQSLQRRTEVPTLAWEEGSAPGRIKKWLRGARISGAAVCSVVPRATPLVRRFAAQTWRVELFELSATTIRGLEINYPKPATIGPDRLANALAARRRFGAPVVVVDFGTAVTFDVVDSSGAYVGGIIAPGLAAMTDYLHEKTALLPRIKIREVRASIGKSTEKAMLIGAVHGYRGLIQGLLGELKGALNTRHLPVIATGGCAALVSAGLPEIRAVVPELTLEGLRMAWELQANGGLRFGAKKSVDNAAT